MKHYKQSLWAIMLVLFTFSGCEKNPFYGTDNYMLDFSLQQADGTLFEGEIAGNAIQLYIPSSVDKTNLTAKYTLSELATVSPNPATVKDWSTEQSFTVTSHSGSKREYTVKVKKEDVVSSESVYLHTDEEVAAFAAKKIDIINGNLTIGAPTGTDSISNIDALAGLKEVRYKLIVNPTYKGDLKVLSNLQSVGSLIINGVPKELKEIDLPKLEHIRGTFSSQSDSINKIVLSNILTAGNISIKSIELTEFSMPELKNIENFDCRFPQLDNLEMRKVETIGSLNLNGASEWSDPKQVTSTIKEVLFPALKQCVKLSIQTFLTLEVIEANNLTQVNDVSLTNLPALTSIKLNELKTINEKLYTATNITSYTNTLLKVFEAPKLETAGEINLEAFKSLETVKFPMLEKTDRFRITPSVKNWETPKLTEVNLMQAYNYAPSIFKNLKKITNLSMDKISYTGDVDLSHIEFGNSIHIVLSNNGITSIKLPKTIGGNSSFELNLASNVAITSLPLVTGIEECNRFVIAYASGVTEIKLPASLKKVTQLLNFSGNVLTVSGDNLQEAGEITYSANNLTSISFPRLEKVSGKLSIFGKFLEDIQLPKLTSVGRLEVGGSYSGWQNEKLTNLNFLTSLTSLETLEIKFCKVLTDYSGLKNAVNSGSITAENWTAKAVHDNAYNPTFEDIKAGRYVKP